MTRHRRTTKHQDSEEQSLGKHIMNWTEAIPMTSRRCRPHYPGGRRRTGPRRAAVAVASLVAIVTLCAISTSCRRTAKPLALPAMPTKQQQQAAASCQFEDATKRLGVTMVHENGQDAGHYSILESLGGGVAMSDFDGDGRLDLCFSGGGRFEGKKIVGIAPKLFMQAPDGKFEDVTQRSLPQIDSYYSHGVAAADYNHDGFTDFLITGYSGLKLYRNQGDGTFDDATAELPPDKLWSSSAAWGDLNGDGDLDLYIAHYVDWSFENDPFCPGPFEGQQETCPPANFQGLRDSVFFSQGDGGFTDVSDDLGLASGGKGLGVAIADIDLDGDSDIYIANDAEANFLYLNDGQGRFEELGSRNGCALGDSANPDGSMGVDIGDYNQDGLLDIWVANFESESFALYHHDGNAEFRHVSNLTGIASAGALYVGWGTGFFDFDRDMDLDLFASNGHVARHPRNAPIRQQPLLFENLEGKRFVARVGKNTYFDSSHMGRGSAAGDIDEDGDIDLVVSHIREPAAVLLNTSKNKNHWLNLKLIGTTGNREAIGATVSATAGETTLVRLRKGGCSYASTNDSRLFFGLGEHTKVELKITWPNGKVQELREVDVDRTLIVIENN